MKNVVRLDPTTLSASACMRKIQLSNILGYQPKIGKDEFDFGQALHRAGALFREDRVLGKGFNLDQYIQTGVTYYAQRFKGFKPKLFAIPMNMKSSLSVALGAINFFTSSIDKAISSLIATAFSIINLQSGFCVKIIE